MKSLLRAGLVAALCAPLLAASPRPVDAGVGVVKGEVKNNLGSTLPDVVVAVEGTDLAVDLGGGREYSIELKPGAYWLRAQAFAYRVVRRRVVVTAGGVTDIDFVLNSLVHVEYRGVVSDGVTGRGIPGLYKVLDTPVRPVAFPSHGNFRGFLPRGTYRFEFSSPGYYPNVVEARIPGPLVTLALKPLPGRVALRRRRHGAIYDAGE